MRCVTREAGLTLSRHPKRPSWIVTLTREAGLTLSGHFGF